MRPPGQSRAFSLVEMLVATVVFALLVLMCLQMTKSTTDLVGNGQRRMDALVEGRAALDRLGFDLDQRVRDAQAPVLAQKYAGDDTLGFYIGAESGPTARPVTLVSYRVKNNMIERASEAVTWSALSMSYVPSSPPSGAATAFDGLSEAVFRLECSFLLKGSQTLSATPPADWSDVAAVLVAVAVMDRREFSRLTPTEIQGVADALPDARNGVPVIATWNDALPSLNPRIGRAVRIYQRVFSIN